MNKLPLELKRIIWEDLYQKSLTFKDKLSYALVNKEWFEEWIFLVYSNPEASHALLKHWHRGNITDQRLKDVYSLHIHELDINLLHDRLFYCDLARANGSHKLKSAVVDRDVLFQKLSKLKVGFDIHLNVLDKLVPQLSSLRINEAGNLRNIQQRVKLIQKLIELIPKTNPNILELGMFEDTLVATLGLLKQLPIDKITSFGISRVFDTFIINQILRIKTLNCLTLESKIELEQPLDYESVLSKSNIRVLTLRCRVSPDSISYLSTAISNLPQLSTLNLAMSVWNNYGVLQTLNENKKSLDNLTTIRTKLALDSNDNGLIETLQKFGLYNRQVENLDLSIEFLTPQINNEIAAKLVQSFVNLRTLSLCHFGNGVLNVGACCRKLERLTGNMHKMSVNETLADCERTYGSSFVMFPKLRTITGLGRYEDDDDAAQGNAMVRKHLPICEFVS